jgi:hypothetical protein
MGYASHGQSGRATLQTLRAMFAPVFSKPGMSLERPEIDDAKRVDPL